MEWIKKHLDTTHTILKGILQIQTEIIKGDLETSLF